MGSGLMVGLFGMPSGRPASFSSMGGVVPAELELELELVLLLPTPDLRPMARSAFFACDFVWDVWADLLPKVMPHCSHLNCGLLAFGLRGVAIVAFVAAAEAATLAVVVVAP